jgi:hypothetical protein
MDRQPNGAASLAERAAKGAAASSLVRKGKKRDGPGHPATSDREYTLDEVEFMVAVQAEKERTHNPFPSLTALLTILKSLGYAKPCESPEDSSSA